jgi:hypothetical protein
MATTTTTRTNLSAPPGVMVTMRVPLLDRFRFRFRSQGEVIDVVMIWTTRSRWLNRAEASDPAWLTRSIGPFLVAARLDR